MSTNPLWQQGWHGITQLKTYVEAKEAAGDSVDWNYRDEGVWMDEETYREYHNVSISSCLC